MGSHHAEPIEEMGKRESPIPLRGNLKRQRVRRREREREREKTQTYVPPNLTMAYWRCRLKQNINNGQEYIFGQIVWSSRVSCVSAACQTYEPRSKYVALRKGAPQIDRLSLNWTEAPLTS